MEETFADVLTRMIEEPKLTEQIDVIRVCRTYPLAEICWTDSGEAKRVVYLPDGRVPERFDYEFLLVWCNIEPALIQKIAHEMALAPSGRVRVGHGGGDA